VELLRPESCSFIKKKERPEFQNRGGYLMTSGSAVIQPSMLALAVAVAAVAEPNLGPVIRKMTA
jgi:hypothetical protein